MMEVCVCVCAFPDSSCTILFQFLSRRSWRVSGGALGTCDESITLQDEATGNVVIDALPYVPLEIYMAVICEKKRVGLLKWQ